MDKRVLWGTVYKQILLDFNATLEQLVQGEMYVTRSIIQPGQRIYHTQPYSFRGIVLAGGGVLSVAPEMEADFIKVAEGMAATRVLDMPNLQALWRTLKSHNQKLVELHNVYVADRPVQLGAVGFEPLWYEEADLVLFQGTKGAAYFANALNFNPLFPEQFAVGALVKGELVGLAGASRDCEDLWQIGVDVLPIHERKGVGTQLVMLLRQRLESMGKVAIYGTNGSHIAAQRLAISAGFSPGWIELYAQPRKEGRDRSLTEPSYTGL